MTFEYLSAYLLLNLLQISLGLQDPLNWWKTTTIYQIYPLSFKDSNGDGIGDLQGIISKVDYLKELGVGAVWLNPFYQSPLEAYGYDITDYYSIDPVFGTIEDFDELKARLKDLDIKLILDVVPNHTSNKHPWFLQSIDRIDPYTNYYIWKDGKINENGEREPTNNWVALISGSAWQWNEKRGQYFLHQFGANMPDLNYHNPDVHDEMKNVFNYWAGKGADGFRIDAMHFMYEDALYRDEMINPEPGYSPSDYNYLIHNGTAGLPETYELMKEWRSFIDTEFNNVDNYTRILVPEAYASIEQTMEYYGNSTNPGAHFPFNFNLINYLHMGSSAWDVLSAVLDWVNNLPQGMPSNWIVGNHDQNRVWNRVGGQLVDAMNMLATLLPGTNFLYYGEEIGMQNNPSGSDPSRAPFQWDNTHNAGFSTGDHTFYPVNEDYTYVNLQQEKEDARSHFHVYQSLMEARKTLTIQNGQLYQNVMGNDVFSFSRELEGADRFVVLMNMGEEMETVNPKNVYPFISDPIQIFTSSVDSKYPPGSNVSSTSVSLDPKEAVVLKSY